MNGSKLTTAETAMVEVATEAKSAHAVAKFTLLAISLAGIKLISC